MSETFQIEFPGTGFPPICLGRATGLATELTVVNSPILFGCRSGICGTCLVEVDVLHGVLERPSEEEAEALEVFAPGNVRARLACQISLSADISLRKIDSE